MKLWLLTASVCDYDFYSGMVVAADTAEEALLLSETHWKGEPEEMAFTTIKYGCWPYADHGELKYPNTVDYVPGTAKHIGESLDDKKGLVLASFRAG